MPEGDAVHRAARRLQALVGERVEVETPHPRAAATGVATRLDGRTLVGVKAHGKNLLLQFDGGYVLRSHLRMSGRWSVVPRGFTSRLWGGAGKEGEPEIRGQYAAGTASGRARSIPPPASSAAGGAGLRPAGAGSGQRREGRRVGRPWLIMRGSEREAVLWNGPVLELTARAVARLGPDILAAQPDFERMLANLRAQDLRREVGDALLDQRVVAGIGNMWKAEALWRARVSPWLLLGEATDEQLRDVLAHAARLMRRRLDGVRDPHAVYRRVGRPCSRCGATIRSHGQGDDNRTAYWCPGCQGLQERGADRPVR
jgi:endonuclease-8